ncbi:MAG: 30S ribosomal protein S20 [Candidatus Jorgensenbacteria bacterium]|nr:30S ribosomal protein S20 [Candidatus Jorgensenbacteria bacterium]
MPKIQSAKKALRQNRRRNAQNLGRDKIMKDAIRAFKKLILAKKEPEAREQLKKVYKVLDKMAKVDFIKKGKASRLKSRLAKKLG